MSEIKKVSFDTKEPKKGSFNLFGSISKDEIRVGYISTTRGYITGVDICAANAHAKQNPGETFIYKPDRKTVKFLNINGVNELKNNPTEANTDEACPDGLSLNKTPKPVSIVFMGGGGTGVVGNPVIGDDGGLLAVDLVNGGFGYQYPPLVQVKDDSGIGAGAVVEVEMCEVNEETIYYADEEDFEEYQICPDPYRGLDAQGKKRSAYGDRWSPSGKNLGPWVPQEFTQNAPEPFTDVVDEWMKKVHSSGKDWWTTRMHPPLAVTSNGRTTKEKFNVEHWQWGGTAEALTDVAFEIHWHSPHRTKGLGFEFVAQDGSHSFRIVDTSGKDDGKRTDVYQVKENTTYNVKPIGKRPGVDFKSKQSARVTELAEQGLLKKIGVGRKQDNDRQLDANKVGTGDKIFADFLDTLDDDDDIQVQAQRGKFTASNPRKVDALRKKRTTYDLTYRLQTGKQQLTRSFMNTYAISPKPKSNAKGSDFSGRWFTFEWDVNFPYDGEYTFRGARDDKAFLYIDNEKVGSLEHLRGRKLVGTVTGKGFKQHIKEGDHKVRIDLYNEPQMEEQVLQQPPAASTSDVKFQITSGSMFSNGITIEGLDIREEKPFTPVGMGKKGQLNISHNRKVEFGKKYKVIFTSKGKSGSEGSVIYNGLNPANESIRVTRNGKRVELKDGDGNDTNFSLDIDSGKAKFSIDGKQLQGSGNIKLTAAWSDNPNTAGVAVESIQIGDKTWRRKGRRGSQTHTITLSGGGAKPNIKLRTKGPTVIQMEDFTDNDWTDLICTASTGQFTDISGNVAYFSVPHPEKRSGKSSDTGKQTKEIFNTIDYIDKANRKLWRTNVYDRGGFLNDYGICPFDTNIQLKDNPYAGKHKIVWANVNFPIDGNYDIEVEVDDNVEIQIGSEVTLTKKGFIGDTSVGTGKTKVTRFIKQGNHNIIADLEQKPGGAYSFKQDGKLKKIARVKFDINISSWYGNKISIPGLLALGKVHKSDGGSNAAFSGTKEVEIGKEYDVILTSIRESQGVSETRVRTGAIRFRDSKDKTGKLSNKGPRLEFEDLLGKVDPNTSHDDIVATVSEGRFYDIKGNRCKFMVGETFKGINPMALAINIESTFDKKQVQAEKSWNENPFGVGMTIEAPLPPVPQEPIPLAEGRCPNNPFWTTRFPGAEKKWFPVRYKGWGELLNKHAISPLPPFDKHRNPLVDVDFEVHWYSPHRTKGLGYRFEATDGSHAFTIRDTSKAVGRGQKTEKIKVKLATTYTVKAFGKRANAQGSQIGKNLLGKLGKFDNSKVVELAEQGLLNTMKSNIELSGVGKDLDKLDANRDGVGDKIFADFLDTLDDADDLQIQAGSGLFTASNPREVFSLQGKRTTYDLTYRINQPPPNDAGSFTNTWTKTFAFGGYYKVKMEVDDIGEFWIDDEKHLELNRKTGSTYAEKLIYIDGPTSQGEQPVNHDIKVVVQNFKSEKRKQINAKVFNTLDWLSGTSSKAEKKVVGFKITTGSMFANSIKIPELDIHESKPFTPVSQGQRGQLNVTREREVEVNKVYDVEFYSSTKSVSSDWGIKYNGLHPANRNIRVVKNGKRIELLDGDGSDTNASLNIDSGNVKFSDDGKRLIVNGSECKITLDWSDNPSTAGVAVNSIEVGGSTWRRRGRRGSQTQTIKFPSGSNVSNIRLRNKGESVVQMEDHTDNDWTDLICGATEGRFFDLNGNKCKYIVGAATRVAGGVSAGEKKGGISYQGPHLFHYTDSRWGSVLNREGVSPISSPTQSLSDPNDNIGGKKIMTWKDVDFPQTGKYQVNFVADNWGDLFIDEKKVLSVKNNFKQNDYSIKDIDVGKGKHDIRIELTNGTASNIFLKDPTGVALRIYTLMDVGTGTYKSWMENPVGVSAKLIPPPCPKPVRGKGRVCTPKVKDPGNGYPPGEPGGYPVQVKIKTIDIKDPGINYNCAKDKARLVPDNGAKLTLKCDPFGKIGEVIIDDPGAAVTEMPEVVIDSDTGINFSSSVTTVIERVPPDVENIIQVTDLVGIKQTGYYKGKPYYGAVFYENGVKYSGWYKTAGEMIQIYDTMQESIDGEVTTRPSAIQRQGSDITSNDPNLNIPGTPQNLT